MTIANILIGAWMWHNLEGSKFWWTLLGFTIASICDHYFGNQIGHALAFAARKVLGEASP